MTSTERQLLAKLSREDRNASNKRPKPKTFARSRPVLDTGDRIIAGPSGGLTAASGYVLGSGTCKWLKISGTTIKDTGRTFTVYNFANSVVLANGYRLGIARRINGKWIAISENCGDVRTYSAPASL